MLLLTSQRGLLRGLTRLKDGFIDTRSLGFCRQVKQQTHIHVNFIVVAVVVVLESDQWRASHCSTADDTAEARHRLRQMQSIAPTLLFGQKGPALTRQSLPYVRGMLQQVTKVVIDFHEVSDIGFGKKGEHV